MIRAALLVLAILMATGTAQAAPQGKAAGQSPDPAEAANQLLKPQRNPDGTYTVKMLLSSLTPAKNHTLRGTSAAFSFSLPVPERWDVKSASISFGYVNSSSLVARLSRLSFLVGGRVLGQIELRPESPKGKVEIPIPGNLLAPGYNECVFRVAQSYTEEYCESPQHQSLWTNLELETATVEITYAMKPVPARLSAVSDFLFDSRAFLGSDVNIVLPEFSEKSVKLAAMAASGVALRMDYQAARTTVSNELKLGRDNIVIGDAAFAQRLLGSRAPKIGESTMALLPGAGPSGPDPQTAVVVLSGSPEGVEKAVRAFSYLSFPFPDAPEADLSQVTDPEPEMLEAAKNISRDKEYTLRSMGYFTKTVRGQPIDLSYTFPSGLDLNPNSYVTLSLHVAYAPGMREDSVLMVYINGVFVGGVHFEDVKGGTFLDYRINLPLYAMKKGTNTITLTPVLNPLKTRLCESYQSDNLAMTLYDDSTLTFPDIPLWVKLPDLTLFYQDVFPYAQWPDMRGATLLLGDKEQETVNAAVNLAAQAAQRTGLPPLKLDVSFGPAASGNVIAVGGVDSLPKELVSAAPFSLLPQGKRPYPQMQRPKAQDEEAAAHKAPLWSKFLPFLWERGRKSSDVTQYIWADVRSGAALSPGKGFVTQFKAPATAADTVTLFTAATAKDVDRLAARLWEPAVRSMIAGDVAVVDLDSARPKAASLEVGEKYYMGKIGAVPKLTILVNTYPWTSLSVVMVLLLVFAWAAWRMLKVVRAKRQ
ncbi:cellulose biosynthesis cyclic di-GMP-binding regulatory protein BcsB [Fundidesulfovibrio terrae]|uniref:cellulose biosynthesis cyclic di-GMP-binding regulatory protein BcsB n=1 Tax=Fundidesulfovibrio terrae TaxID=2922866 RepID=UPI001FAFA3A0|nr:cellulose biosynthesis cyclic di-GMP-binding regulatory protein BcsB [Fundidesulfovibrio terrae]